MIRIDQVEMPLEYDTRSLIAAAAREMRLKPEDISDVRIARKAVDARDKRSVRWSLNLLVSVRDEKAVRPGGRVRIEQSETPVVPVYRCPPTRPVVVGLGPCGLFAALTLAKAGARPIVLERGRKAAERAKDVTAFREEARFDPESNILFGEGGAGAFSDGKLTTGIKHPYQRKVLETLVKAGAPEEILIRAKPHIGTDRLPGVVAAIRGMIEEYGGEVIFGARLRDIALDRGRVCGAEYEKDGKDFRIDCTHLVLAIGHSARDTYEMLRGKVVPMEKKPFAVGARIEHPQRLIDRAQYGVFAGKAGIGAADYKLAVHLPDGRGVYTFCMCPGGEVTASASEKGMLAVNGMSPWARDGRNANAALLVSVTPDDFPGEDVLSGIAFQREWERRAFECGGGDWRAPAQTLRDFMERRPSKGPGAVLPTYRPGVNWCDLSECLPRFVAEDMRAAIPLMDRKLHGFASGDAVLTGVETRSSSPVRILRDAGFESGIKGLYPAGEGAGYAGGIVSAAVDGMRCADAVLGFTYPG